jgi:hypothetical protein
MRASSPEHRRADSDASRHDLSIYAGRTLLGHVREEGGRCRATTSDGRDLGHFPNRKSAADAIGREAKQESSVR